MTLVDANYADRFLPNWSPEETQSLQTLWAAGLSATLIGKRLGRSRNSVIGKVYRKGWQRYGAPTLQRDRPGPPKRRSKLWIDAPVVFVPPKPAFPANALCRRKPEKAAPTPRLATPEPTALNLKVWELGDSQCHWPVNEGGPYLFCGHAKSGAGPYCEYHAERGVQSKREIE